LRTARRPGRAYGRRCEAVARFGQLDGAFSNAGIFGAFGPLHRDTTGNFADPEMLAQRARRAPLGRLGSCEEVANAAPWLVSPLSSYVTGQTIVVDGGVTAGSAVIRSEPQ
jgi:enoyl-[acyl-carrier-protein] reductase (NADH)